MMRGGNYADDELFLLLLLPSSPFLLLPALSLAGPTIDALVGKNRQEMMGSNQEIQPEKMRQSREDMSVS